jgi:hypothetical protein
MKGLTHLWTRLRHRRYRTPNDLQYQTKKITIAKQQSITPWPHQTQVRPTHQHNPRQTQIHRGSQENGANCQGYQINEEILLMNGLTAFLPGRRGR